MVNEKEEASIEIETLKRDLIEKIHECDTLQSQVTDTVALKDTEVGELKARLEETELKYQVRMSTFFKIFDKFNWFCKRVVYLLTRRDNEPFILIRRFALTLNFI